MKINFQRLALITLFLWAPWVAAEELDGFSEISRPRILVQEKEIGYQAQGFRLGLHVPNFMLIVNSQSPEGSLTVQDFQTDLRSFSVGYVSIPDSGLGFLGGLSLGMDSRFQDRKSYYRLQAVGTYTLGEVLHFKAGANFSGARFEGLPANLSPGLGVQAGFGIQFTEIYGLDIDYVLMNQTARTSANNFLDVQQSGLEIGLNATF